MQHCLSHRLAVIQEGRSQVGQFPQGLTTILRGLAETEKHRPPTPYGEPRYLHIWSLASSHLEGLTNFVQTPSTLIARGCWAATLLADWPQHNLEGRKGKKCEVEAEQPEPRGTQLGSALRTAEGSNSRIGLQQHNLTQAGLGQEPVAPVRTSSCCSKGG